MLSKIDGLLERRQKPVCEIDGLLKRGLEPVYDLEPKLLVYKFVKALSERDEKTVATGLVELCIDVKFIHSTLLDLCES